MKNQPYKNKMLKEEIENKGRLFVDSDRFESLLQWAEIPKKFTDKIESAVNEIGDVVSMTAGLEGDDFIKNKFTVEFKKGDGGIISRKYDRGLMNKD